MSSFRKSIPIRNRGQWYRLKNRINSNNKRCELYGSVCKQRVEWSRPLLKYDYEIVYWKGSLHHVPHASSRWNNNWYKIKMLHVKNKPEENKNWRIRCNEPILTPTLYLISLYKTPRQRKEFSSKRITFWRSC